MDFMACSLKCSSLFSGFNDTMLGSNPIKVSCFFRSTTSSLEANDSISKKFPFLGFDFLGKPLVVPDQKISRNWNRKHGNGFSVQMETICVSKSLRWWEKNLKPNMLKINSAEELVYSLQNAGNRLVIIDFYSPGCGGCKTLHPKICQLAEQNPNAIFLEVNYEDLKNMCQILNIHVLPFFRFYRGSEGRLCSFSCTNATIKKFKDALAKHGSDRCSIGPAKGLNESEITKLALAGELSTNLLFPSVKEESMEDLLMRSMEMSGLLDKVDSSSNQMMLEKQVALP